MKLVSLQSFLLCNNQMKDKFSIFSPTASKTDTFQTSINFTKSPNKIAVYQSNHKIRETPKYNNHQSLSSSNLQHLKRLPYQYSNLRQTLNFKTADFDGCIQQQNGEKLSKSSNILRQHHNTKSNYKPKNEKVFSESFTQHEIKSPHDVYYRNQATGALGYSKIGGSNLAQSKSMHTLSDSKNQRYQNTKRTQDKNNWAQNSNKWKAEQGVKNYRENWQHSKIVEQIKILKKIAGSNNEEEQLKQSKSRLHIERKYSQHDTYEPYISSSEQSIFRKKIKEKEEPLQCYTPKIPKFTYQERFKKIGSPTSTENSDSRSPSNKFVEVIDLKKKSGKHSIEDYCIGRILGQGKFGVVMIASHKKSGCLVALKKIPKAMIKSHLMVQQLTLQIRLQSCLNHKNILGMYGFFDDSTHLYIVLQYMQQGTLYSQLKKNRVLSQKQSAGVIKQITKAIQYLHDQDIAHRDIKPQNIVISNNVYKLCDFGWATLCNQRRKTYCGTFDYSAPQILEGEQYDMSVDLWCLGVLTFQLLTGKAPFYHISRKETKKKILNVETQAITYPETMSQSAVDFIEKLIRRDPNERMKTCDALKHPFLKNAQDL